MSDVSLLPFVVAIPAYVVIGFTIFDAARRADLSIARKALWIGTAAVLPLLGTFLYLFNRPLRDPARSSAKPSVRASSLMKLVQEHEAGLIGDDEFAAAKRRIFTELAPQQIDP